MQSGGSFKLTMAKGPTPDAVFELDKDDVSLGRDVSNDIVINDAEVSRRHARFTRQGTGYALEDRGSTNGTFVNGQRVSGRRALSNGDAIGIGETVSLTYEATVEVGATVLSPRMAAAFDSAATRLEPTAMVADEPAAPEPQPAPAVDEAAAEAGKQAGKGRWIAIGCGCLAIVACLALLVGLWIARASIIDSVCQVFPC